MSEVQKPGRVLPRSGVKISTLRLQGRCFKCKRKGHIARACKNARRRKFRLVDLPVEILELICGYVIDLDDWLPMPWKMYSFRLACKAMNLKTLDFFARNAFKLVPVDLSFRRLSVILAISENHLFASKVKTLYIDNFDKYQSAEDYQSAQETLNSATASARQRREAQRHIRRANIEQTDRSFIERSASDGVMLGIAVQHFQNLKEIFVSCHNLRKNHTSIRHTEDRELFSTGHHFALAVACAALSGRKLELLSTPHSGNFDSDKGVEVSTLSMPRYMLDCFSSLQRLNLRLETCDSLYKDPSTWHLSLAKFLAYSPQLQDLALSFRKSWAKTEAVLAAVAARCTLPKLQLLSLTGIRCSGEDLNQFLKIHSTLCQLTLEDFDITGQTPYRAILEMLAETHAQLKYFHSSQIAQNSRRLFFRNFGDVIVDPHSYGPVLSCPKDFFDDFMRVHKPQKYTVTAEEWEGVQSKIALLSTDVAMSHVTYHPEYNIEPYRWFN